MDEVPTTLVALDLGEDWLSTPFGGDRGFAHIKMGDYWAIKDLKVLHRRARAHSGLFVTFLSGNPDYHPESAIALQPPSGEYSGTVVFYYDGTFQVDGKKFYGTFGVIGDLAICYSVLKMLDATGNVGASIGIEELKKNYVPIEIPVTFKFLTGPQYTIQKCSEARIYDYIKEKDHLLPEIIISVLLFLFPYIEEDISKKYRIIEYRPMPIAEAHRANNIGTRSLNGESDRLGALALCLLGPAYSNNERLPEQVARRAKAVAASLNLSKPSVDGIKSLHTQLQWSQDKIPPVVFDFIGYAVCKKPEGPHDVMVKEAELMTIANMIQQGLINKTAGELLEQARMVYARFRSTSIAFIPAILPEIKKLMPASLWELAAEIEKFEAIKEHVLASPFMGLCSRKPEAYNIRQFPALTYAALKYHEKNLVSPEEKELFKAYKVNEISRHMSFTLKTIMDCIVDVLPDVNMEAMGTRW